MPASSTPSPPWPLWGPPFRRASQAPLPVWSVACLLCTASCIQHISHRCWLSIIAAVWMRMPSMSSSNHWLTAVRSNKLTGLQQGCSCVRRSGHGVAMACLFANPVCSMMKAGSLRGRGVPWPPPSCHAKKKRCRSSTPLQQDRSTVSMPGRIGQQLTHTIVLLSCLGHQAAYANKVPGQLFDHKAGVSCRAGWMRHKA